MNELHLQDKFLMALLKNKWVYRIIAARKEEAKVGFLIEEFQAKTTDFFNYVRNEDKDGKRLVVKINSHSSESEIVDDFSKIYRRYKALKRKIVGDYFFKETEDLVEKLSADFEELVKNK